MVIELGGPNGLPEVMILDTKDGHLWRYWDQSAIPNVTTGGEGVIYLGKLRPGTKTGEVVISHPFQ